MIVAIRRAIACSWRLEKCWESVLLKVPSGGYGMPGVRTNSLKVSAVNQRQAGSLSYIGSPRVEPRGKKRSIERVRQPTRRDPAQCRIGFQPVSYWS